MGPGGDWSPSNCWDWPEVYWSHNWHPDYWKMHQFFHRFSQFFYGYYSEITVVFLGLNEMNQGLLISLYKNRCLNCKCAAQKVQVPTTAWQLRCIQKDQNPLGELMTLLQTSSLLGVYPCPDPTSWQNFITMVVRIYWHSHSHIMPVQHHPPLITFLLVILTQLV